MCDGYELIADWFLSFLCLSMTAPLELGRGPPAGWCSLSQLFVAFVLSTCPES